MTYIVRLPAIPPAEHQLVGGKAAGCAKLFRMGLPVPNGFALTTLAYNSFLGANQLDRPLSKLIKGFLDSKDEILLKSQCEEFQNQVRQQSLPVPIRNAINKEFQTISYSQVSVRSSANVEDAGNTAFAGVYHSILNVDHQDVENAIVECWAQAFSYEALTHAMRNGIDPSQCRVALLIQDMVEADFAGVIFTEEPSGHKPDQGNLAFVKGLGDSLMDGSQDGYSATFSRHNNIIDGQFECKNVPLGLLQELVNTALQIEEELGHPQDIEWAIKDKQLFFLQTRPITTIEAKSKKPICWTRELSEERFPGPISPLGWSIMQDVLATNVQTLGDRFGLVAKHSSDVARTIDNYIYSNEQFFSIPGSMKVEIGKQLRYAPLYMKEFFGSFRYMRNAVTQSNGFGMQWLMLTRVFRAFIFPHAYEVLNAWDEHLVEVLNKLEVMGGIDPSDISDQGMLGYKKMFDAIGDEYMEPDLAVFVVKSACSWLIDKIGHEVAEVEAAELISDLTSGVIDNITLRRNAELEDIYHLFSADEELIELLKDGEYDILLEKLSGEPEKAFLDFVHRCGHVTANWDVREPTWGENPQTILALMRSFTLSDTLNSARNNTGERLKQFENAKLRVMNALSTTPWMADFFEELLTLLHEFMRIDEEHNFHCSRMYIPLRKYFGNVASRFIDRQLIEKEDDIYFLTLNEIEQLLDSTPDFPRRYLVNNRIANFERAEKVRPVDKYEGQKPLHEENLVAVREGNVLKGKGASPGVFTGTVRVVETPDDLSKFEKGDILVTTSPKPAWTPLYSAAGALVAATGSLLSHGLISAREYRLPAVIGIADVINELKNGQKITVNGSTGVITLED